MLFLSNIWHVRANLFTNIFGCGRRPRYIEGYSKIKNLTLTQDEIEVLASGLMEVEVLDKRRTVVGDGINFWIKINAKVKPDKMEEMAKRMKEKAVVEDYKLMQKAYAKSLAVESFGKPSCLGPAYNKRATAYFQRQYDRAVDDFSKVIVLDHNNGDVLALRGISYYRIGNVGKAISDLQKACDMGTKEACDSAKWILQNR